MSTSPGPARPPADGPKQSSGSRAAALLAAAAPLAAVAVLAATPPTVAGRDGTPSAALHAAVLGGDNPCATTLITGAHDTIKYPTCAGD